MTPVTPSPVELGEVEINVNDGTRHMAALV